MNASEELRVALVCKEMGWTYQEYMDQPISFLETLSIIRRMDAAHQKMQNRSGKHKR